MKTRPKPRFLDDVAIGLLSGGMGAIVVAVVFDNTVAAFIAVGALLAGMLVGGHVTARPRDRDGEEIE